MDIEDIIKNLERKHGSYKVIYGYSGNEYEIHFSDGYIEKIKIDKEK